MKKFFKITAAVALSAISAFALSSCASPKESFDITVSGGIAHGKVYPVQTTAKAGEKVLLACVPDAGYKLTGYTVGGKNIEGNTFTMPDGDIEVSANFGLITYHVTYVIDGGTVDGTNPDTYTVEDGDIQLVAPKKEGFASSGWFYYFADIEYSLDSLDDFNATVIKAGTTGELTLYARYYNAPHLVTVDDNTEHGYMFTTEGLSEVITGQNVSLQCVADDYYELDYFTVNGQKIEGDSFIMPDCDVTLSAKIKPVEYKITYELNGGEMSAEAPSSYTVESGNISLPKPAKQNYEFNCWGIYDSYGNYMMSFYDNENIDVYSIIGIGDVTFHAEFSEL